GGTTANRPGSPTEGMLFFDTDTGQLLVYGNGTWQPMTRTATKVVAASNSQSKAADYTVTSAEESAGNADAKIQAAINALPAQGGTVYLMEGTYTIDTNITLPSNVTLAGSGEATIIKFKNSVGAGTFYALTNSGSVTNITIRDLQLDGNKSNNATGSPTMMGIRLSSAGSGSGTSTVLGARISGVTAKNFRNNGIAIYDSLNVTVQNNGAINNDVYGIVFDNFNLANNLTTVSKNLITNNRTAGNLTGIGVYSQAGTSVTNNISEGNSAYGIDFEAAQGAVTGNIAGKNGWDGIFIAETNENDVTGNKIYDSGTVDATKSGLTISNSDRNIIGNNTITDTAGTGYAINIINSTSDNNYLGNNTFSGTGASSINDAGTGTVYANQARSANGAQLTTKLASGTDAFQIQNASGNSLLTVDTSNSEIEIGKAGASGIDGKLVLYNAANSNTVTLSVGTTSASYTLKLPTSAGSVNQCLMNDATTAGVLVWGSCGGGGSSSTLQDDYNNDANGSDAIIGLTSTDGGILIRDASTPLSTAFAVQDSTGSASYLSVASTGVTLGVTMTVNSNLTVTGDIYNKGITWTSRTSAADNIWKSVTYGNGLFVAVSCSIGTVSCNSTAGNRVMTSPDGINWTSRTSAADNEWYSVTYGNGLFVAVSGTGTGNRVMTSPDGITWTSRSSAADNSWRS
ncbi:MAG TPA: right-handed parallel beta-helix repeat-containing protein, partial [Candidatus Saccharimonadales bacterium]|nr:right-handed parallel beta-helix repeat-containing protein [Candidatus Saccharimonadales bacterium]